LSPYLDVIADGWIKKYIHENANGNGDIKRMKSTVWIVFTSAMLWLIGFLAHLAYWWRHRERRTRFTSRARL
jgi:hypothetical protein